ncbi:MAG: c-type cytochrome [Chitinophagaceae bacterium]
MIRMRTLLQLTMVAGVLTLVSCGGGESSKDKPVDVQELTKSQPEQHGTQLTEADVQLSTPLNADWVKAGQATYELKCQSCHRLTEEKLVGPGWKDVTKHREPVWIMNMITNVDMMLETDPEAQKLLEQCMVRMPNQNIEKEEARKVLEFMRHNDGVK